MSALKITVLFFIITPFLGADWVNLAYQPNLNQGPLKGFIPYKADYGEKGFHTLWSGSILVWMSL